MFQHVLVLGDLDLKLQTEKYMMSVHPQSDDAETTVDSYLLQDGYIQMTDFSAPSNQQPTDPKCRPKLPTYAAPRVPKHVQPYGINKNGDSTPSLVTSSNCNSKPSGVVSDRVVTTPENECSSFTVKFYPDEDSPEGQLETHMHVDALTSINLNDSYFVEKKDSNDVNHMNSNNINNSKSSNENEEKTKTILRSVEYEELLKQACELYWQEIKAKNINEYKNKKKNSNDDDENIVKIKSLRKDNYSTSNSNSDKNVETSKNSAREKDDDDSDEGPIGLQEEMDVMTKLLLGIQPKRGGGSGKKSVYFTDDDFESWEWPIYLEKIINNEGNWQGIYQIIEYNFSLEYSKKINSNEYHSFKILASNECLDFLWSYVAYCYFEAKNAKYTLGKIDAMLNLLIKTNNLFKGIMIAYDFELNRFSKYLNHYLKIYLKSINKDILSKIEQIFIRRIKPNCYGKGTIKNSSYCCLKTEFEKLQFRMRACKTTLKENGVEIIKL